MVRERTVEERVAEQEAKALQLAADVDVALTGAADAVTRADDAVREVGELRELVTQARAVLTRLEGYERDLQWLRDERRKAR